MSESFIEYILGIIAGGSILVLVLAFLSKGLFRLLLDKDLESHKARISAESQRSLEEFKASLELRLRREATVHTRFHSEHTDRISDVFGLVTKAWEETSDLLKEYYITDHDEFAQTLEDDEHWTTYYSSARAQIADVNMFITRHRFWFSETTCELVIDASEVLERACYSAERIRDIFAYPDMHHLWHEEWMSPAYYSRKWIEIYNHIVKDEFVQVMANLENHFRRQVGTSEIQTNEN